MIALDWRAVPAGPFLMGSDPAAAFPPDADESPARLVELAPFRLARTAVTNAQYADFAVATGRALPEGGATLPVTYVTLDDALAFCAWAGVRLPTEEEWEAAARGGGDRIWPWGDTLPSPARAVFSAGIGQPEPVGSRPLGASAQGILDLAGNVCEWVAGDGLTKGGSFIHDAGEIRSSSRLPLLRDVRDHYVGFRVAAVGPGSAAFDWIDLPGGSVWVGREPVPYAGPARGDEVPQRRVELDAFELSLTPVTNNQYAEFVAATGTEPPPHWSGESPPPGRGDHPVTYVDWFDAGRFCAWAGGRLPTEAEWEKGARGADARRFPWGNERDADRAHFGSGEKTGDTERVDARPQGASPYGLLGMSGNVWEWVASVYAPYGECTDEGNERVLRGGSFMSPGLDHLRCAMRSRSRPVRRQRHIGFRVAR